MQSVTLTTDLAEKVMALGTITDNPVKQEQEAEKLLQTVPRDFTCFPFGIGVWFRATTTCTGGTEFSVEEAHEEAARRNDDAFSTYCGKDDLMAGMTRDN